MTAKFAIPVERVEEMGTTDLDHLSRRLGPFSSERGWMRWAKAGDMLVIEGDLTDDQQMVLAALAAGERVPHRFEVAEPIGVEAEQVPKRRGRPPKPVLPASVEP